MPCDCCQCKQCHTIGGPILYIDSNYERVLNPSIVNGTSMGTITPIVGDPFSVAAGCTAATYSSVSLCDTGYVFNKSLLPGYDGSQVLTAPSQEMTVLCHLDRVAPTYPGLGLDCVFYCSGLGQQDPYTDYGQWVNGAYPVYTGLDYGFVYLRSEYRAPRSWQLETTTVNAERVPEPPNGIPTPPATVPMYNSPDGSCKLLLDTTLSGTLTNRDPLEIGLRTNVASTVFGSTTVSGRAVHVELPGQPCQSFSVRTGASAPERDYLPINLGPMQLGYVRGDLATATNVNQSYFQERGIHSRGNHLHGRLRRLAIYPTLLSDTVICQILNCWATT